MRDDFLRECMTDVGNVPLDEFNRVFCRLCARRECARSGLNNSVFDRRVEGWQDKLFTNPPRADPDDPKYANIRAKKFLPIASPSVEVKSFTNVPVITPEHERPPPEVPPEPARVEPPEPARVEPAPVPSVPDLEPEAPEPVPEAPEPVPEAPELEIPAPVPVRAPQRHVAQPAENTPFAQGTVLPGGESENVVEPGSTFVFGDD